MRRATTSWPSSARQQLAIAGLTGFAVSQPVLGVFGENPTTLSFHGVQGRELVAFGLVVALVPPLVLIAVNRGAALAGERLGRRVHLVLVAGLATCTLTQLLKLAGLGTPLLVLLAALVLGLASTIAYARVPMVAAWLSYTAILPLLALGAFLAASPASALLSSTNAPDRTHSGAPSVVMIVLDELPTRSLVDPDGTLDARRYPNLAELAGDATWYRHHSTVAPFTEAAVPSLLTGQSATAEAPISTSYPDNLFTLLSPTHDLEVMEVATRLCAYDTCPPEGASATGPGFGDLLTLTRELWFQRISPRPTPTSAMDDFNEAVEADEPVEPVEPDDASPGSAGPFVPDDDKMRSTSLRADTFGASFDADKGSTLYFLHLMLPHQPWRFRPDGTLYADSDPLGLTLPSADNRVGHSWSRWASVVAEQRHLLQVQYTDALVGQIMDDLRASGLYDDSLVIVTADHGISFEPRTHPRWFMEGTIDALAYTPLIVKLPGQTAGGIDDSNVMAIDVLPTIADELGIDLPGEVDGVPIGSPGIAARGGRKVFREMPGDDGRRDGGLVEFDDAEVFATVPERLLGPLPDPSDPLSALDALQSVHGVAGVELDSLHPTSSERFLGLKAFDRLRQPEGTPLGVVIGVLEDAPADGAVLLAVDDVVVAVSELLTDSDGLRGRVTFLLPAGVLDDDNPIRAVLVADGRVQEVAVGSR